MYFNNYIFKKKYILFQKDSVNYDDMNSYFHKYCKDMSPTEYIGAFNYLDVDQ